MNDFRLASSSSRLLRAVLWADAASCAGIAGLHLEATAPLSGLLGLPPTLLVATGWLLVPVVLLAGWLALTPAPSRAGLWLLVVGNWGWVAGCLVLLLAGAAGTVLGQAYLLVQALAVGGLAVLERRGLRGAAGMLMA